MATTLTTTTLRDEFENEEDDCEFEDAQETQLEVDFEQSIEEAKLAVHHFFNNNFIEARKILEPHCKTSMYHALGISVFEFLEAILTFEQAHIQKASDALRHSLSVCNKYRRKPTFGNTLGKMVGRSNYDIYSTEEVHAELCFAETLLLKALLTFIEDETLVSFLKASIKIRSCYNSYKECNMILKTRNWGTEQHKTHFEGGVKVGIGAFNLLISHLPAKIIKLLEFIGFSGSKDVGLEELEKGFKLTKSIRQVLCVLTLLAYHLVVTHVLSHRNGNLNFCDVILKQQLKLYPKGVWFLFFKARLELMRCNLEEAQYWYIKSWKSQDLWPHFHHLCFWELMWTNSMKQDWRSSLTYTDSLLKESRWSRTIYSYQKASLLIMLDTNISRDERNQMEDLMRDLPNYKQRVAGKSLPMEKFVIKRAYRFFAQKKWLCLPIIELMFLWNLFKVLCKKVEVIQDVYKLIDGELNKLQINEYYDDNKALLLLLKGSCLRHMNSPLQSEECLKEVIKLGSDKKIKEDNFLVPYSVVELGLLEMDLSNLVKASTYLEDAKKNYTGYSLESRLHFKIHAAQTDISERTGSTDF